MIVVDTNVLVRFVVGDDGSAEAAALHAEDPEWAAPTILMSELRNVLLGHVRRGVLGPNQAISMCEDAARALGDRIDNVPHDRVIDTALECGLTAYDAEFVVLARTLGVPLATLDREILEGAPDVAVSVRDALSPARRP